ncbi:glycosyl hydrolase family 18 protein [Phytoactinopolyspora endophytica]|uniref:glycosyl hydrolase family 18 protein n=1 Tax=Phytoactinopolyspora endophytica TaxID=1642495 RepID=UPI001F1041A1|nr:glycosyl hydrolase family 18 protein [Phytoactinopolyspora endophytica]
MLIGTLLVATMATRDLDGGAHPRETPASASRIGYVPYWDQERAFDVVLRHLDLFDQISPVWYSLDGSGNVVQADPEHTDVDPETVRFLQENGVQVIPTVTSLHRGEWRPDIVRDMLHDAGATRAHIAALVDLAVTNSYDGIDIDYEDLYATDRDAFTRFVQQLADALHAEGKVLAVAVHPKTDEQGYDERNEAQDYRAIGAAADQVRLMTYDYSWDTSPPGPVAPATWVERVVSWAVTQIPADKVVLGIVLLGYDWSGGAGETVDFEQVQDRAARYGATVERAADGSPWFTYVDESGGRHEVWYEDAASAESKLDLVAEYAVGGVFFWRLGGQDPGVWERAESLAG